QKYIEQIKTVAIPCTPEDTHYDTLLERIGQATIVLLGEATHGTQEFYEIRAQISKLLILEKGFNAITIEGDFPDTWHINEYVQSTTKDVNPFEAFNRFPTWMWRNIPTVNFVQWLQEYNKEQRDKIGFYGLDLYSLYSSIDVIINTLA